MKKKHDNDSLLFSQLLRQLDESITPQHPMMENMLSLSRRVVKIPAEHETEWCRQAVWGVLAFQYFKLIKKRRKIKSFINLLKGPHKVQIGKSSFPIKQLDFKQLLVEPDFSQIRKAQDEGNGVLIVGYHLGPPYPTSEILGDLGYEVLSFSRNAQPPRRNKLDKLENVVLTEGVNSKYALWKARDYLKNNRIVTIIGDGRIGASPITYNLFNEKVKVNMGFAFLAEHTKAKVFFCHHQWTDDFRFKLILQPAEPFYPENLEEGFPPESRWVFAYLESFKSLVKNQPRLISLKGGFWKYNEGGLGWGNMDISLD